MDMQKLLADFAAKKQKEGYKNLTDATIASGRGQHEKAKQLVAKSNAGVLGATTDQTSAETKTREDGMDVIEKPEEQSGFDSAGLGKKLMGMSNDMKGFNPSQNMSDFNATPSADPNLEARKQALMKLLGR